MLYILVFIFFLSLFFLLYGVLTFINADKMKIEDRLNQIKESCNAGNQLGSQEETKSMSFSERVLKPFYIGLSQRIIDITPKHKIAVITKRLERAGILKNSTMNKWLFNKIMIMLVSSLIIGGMVYALAPDIIKSIILILLNIIIINNFFNFYLSKKIEDRKKIILKELPYTLDLITVSVEAGLSFDGAMARVIGNISGELCDEFAKSLKEIRMGIERKNALRNMSERCDVKELSMLITSLIQADELGVSLSKVLRIEAANLREHRKQVSREKAMKAPIKMLFPLVFFIFPSIFIIILGPAVIRIINIFSR